MGDGQLNTNHSVFGPLGQRVFGLVFIAEGLCILVAGRHFTGSWTYKYALWGAKRAARDDQ